MGIIDVVFEASDEVQNKRTVGDALRALYEEAGELSTEVSVKRGLSNKKPGKDGIVGEAVDVILCALDIIRLENPLMTSKAIKKLAQIKCDKWIKGQQCVR
jgi:hypothetical protein